MSIQALAALARRLNREAGAPPIPALYFFTDPERIPDPIAIARTLPPETAVVYRHFGAPERSQTARKLAAACAARRLVLLIAADPDLALCVGAAGVHWPEHTLPALRDARFRLVTASAHSRAAVARVERFGADACILGPVFGTRSASNNAPLGVFRASQLARASTIPVIALGGVALRNARKLSGRGFAGVAAVDAFL
ncbi:MAG: thiamine phosphate synthase [Proteobacteria bacterium]|nr:thiamine phosphate synthase [Pseudomonadota bacterium]